METHFAVPSINICCDLFRENRKYMLATLTRFACKLTGGFVIQCWWFKFNIF
jgi:hypothetical protein